MPVLDLDGVKYLAKPIEIKCLDCEKPMIVRNKKWDLSAKFYGCYDYPECQRTQDYRYEKQIAFINYYNPNKKNAPKNFSNSLFLLKYRKTGDKFKRAFAEKFYEVLIMRLGQEETEEIDFCVSIPDSKGKPNPVIGELFKYPPLSIWMFYFPGMIQQTKERKSQKDAGTFEARKKNLEGIFELQDPESVRGSNILLLDDIVTTGNSIDAAALVLHEESGEFCSAGALGKTWRK